MLGLVRVGWDTLGYMTPFSFGLGHFRPGQVRLFQGMSGFVRLGDVNSGQSSFCHVRTG
jgi:hypothetical protein